MVDKYLLSDGSYLVEKFKYVKSDDALQSDTPTVR